MRRAEQLEVARCTGAQATTVPTVASATLSVRGTVIAAPTTPPPALHHPHQLVVIPLDVDSTSSPRDASATPIVQNSMIVVRIMPLLVPGRLGLVIPTAVESTGSPRLASATPNV